MITTTDPAARSETQPLVNPHLPCPEMRTNLTHLHDCPPDVARALRKLSTQQLDMLRYLWSVHQAGHADTCGAAYVCGGTPASRASMSRTLARLERRGLVLRQNVAWQCRTSAADPKSNRTTHVSLTPVGKAVAKAIADDQPC